MARAIHQYRYYEYNYWCRAGSHFILKSLCVTDALGRLKCPKHHYLVRLNRKQANRREGEQSTIKRMMKVELEK